MQKSDLFTVQGEFAYSNPAKIVFQTPNSLRLAAKKIKRFSSSQMLLLKRINNSSSLNNGNHDRDGVWISDLNYHIFLAFYFSVTFSLVLVSIEMIDQTLKTVFDHTSKHLIVCQKYPAVRRIFNSLLSVWKCGQTQSFVFDIPVLLQTWRHPL